MTVRIGLAMFLGLGLVACDGGAVEHDAGPTGLDGGMPPGECASASDGTPCAGGTGTCRAGVCETSGPECGDGAIDDGEECDDGNRTAFDGCEPDCTFTCRADAECDDGLVCNGAERCGVSAHVCEPGTPAEPGTECTTADIADGVCIATATGVRCANAGCQNGVLEEGEECDDGNEASGDGCEPDCTFTCRADADCDDGSFCTGAETCDLATHRCVAGTEPSCDDDNACTENLCDDEAAACANPLIDNDGDGHAPVELGACGTDCNDRRDDVYPGAEELCDGIDNNCNGMTDESAPTWYIDCDGDGFAATTDSSRMGCEEPASSATGCGGRWTTRRPISAATTDCDDANRNAFPGQTMFFTTAHRPTATGDDARFGDYNCDALAQRDRSTAAERDGSCTLTTNFLLGTRSCSGTGWAGAAAPACGGSGTFYTCGEKQECFPRFLGDRICAGYSLVCEGRFLRAGDPCYCPSGTTCTADCTPGSSGCPWHYYRCPAATTEAGARMACR
ncbi:MAG: hypothetical protein KF729_26195 [Sandaracinaceae bacterium]|nr:hypothetical protein [Sandaracinaceae bacterium]